MIDRTPKNPAPTPASTPADAPIRIDAGRRAALRAGLIAGAGLLLGGCASGGSRVSGDLPGVKWPDSRPNRTDPAAPPHADRGWKRPKSWETDPAPTPQLPVGVRSRSAWAGDAPIPARMNRMLPVRRITIHHDGMSPVALRSAGDVADRLEQIRRAHLTRHFGDIGYHYVIDPMGQVWEGRPLAWQGAHVGGQNEHNIGVVCLGNFEIQRPTGAQVSALDRFVAHLMRTHRVSVHEVMTHRELASTACPGRNLQPHVNQSRRTVLARL